ncbi:Purple acid phosphatase [Operophtera brumata]|uniref:Purple acid phosphatase n=1 Tax=Operophtera brumata TaxID=104452 RepID=A0A0L7LVE1_OPEBR|nr:Purple acid phosphatase [Operophtera brumata]
MQFFVLLLMIGIARAKLVVVPDAHYYCAYCQPEQIHIAFGDSVVEYGETLMDQTAYGAATIFVDGGTEHRKQWIHRVTLENLKFDTKYVYHVGSQYGWSEVYPFKTPPAGQDWVSMAYLQEEAERGHFDVILHVGDFAYDMDSDNARVGDQFMRQITPLAASVPYMTCPGNHEQAYNFSNYASRFSMPGHDSSLFYSFNLGPVHFVSISTEVYYFLQYGAKLIANQYEWLENDLATANLPENRSKRPWIVIMGHRPMYCSDLHDGDCLVEFTRTGVMGMFVLQGDTFISIFSKFTSK